MEEQEQQHTEDQPEPELLYHYTDQKGLLGIVKSKCLWATHSQFLNDSSEYRIVFDALLAWLKRNKTRTSDRWTNMHANWLDTFLQARQTEGIFASSFSHEKQADSLTMWRGYSASIGGYSIGFDRSVLNLIANELCNSGEGCRVELGKCFYVDPEDSNLTESLEGMVELAWRESVDKMSASASNDLLRNAFRSLPINIYEYVKLAALGKHLAFKEENEWRIVIFVEEGTRSKRTEFRQGRSMMLPYMEFSWKDSGLPNPIRRVVVGPTPNNREAVRAVEMLLKRSGIPLRSQDCADGVEVVSSKIPYRNW
jgi:hypothetical protein